MEQERKFSEPIIIDMETESKVAPPKNANIEEEELPSLVLGMFEELVSDWLDNHGTDAFAQAMLTAKATQLNKSSKRIKKC